MTEMDRGAMLEDADRRTHVTETDRGPMQPLGTVRGREDPPEPLEGAQPCACLDPGLAVSRAVRRRISVAPSH